MIRTGLAYWVCPLCKHCQKVNIADIATDFQVAQQHYYGDTPTILQDRPSIVDLEILAERKRLVGRFIRPGGRVIEVGPGSGYFAEWLITRGYEPVLYEYSDTLASQLRVKLGVEVETGSFESQDFLTQRVQACAFFSFHVIEHVIDPLRHLQAGFEAVETGGYGFVATPNASSWQQRFFQTLSPNFDEAHLRVFSARSLGSLCERAGWQVVYIATPEYTSGWLRIFTKILRKIRGEDVTATPGKYAVVASSKFETIYRAVRGVTAPLRYLQRRLNGGNELFVVLYKSASSSAIESSGTIDGASLEAAS